MAAPVTSQTMTAYRERRRAYRRNAVHRIRPQELRQVPGQFRIEATPLPRTAEGTGVMAGSGPTLPTWALQQVVGYLRCTGRDFNAVAKAARDPTGTSM